MTFAQDPNAPDFAAIYGQAQPTAGTDLTAELAQLGVTSLDGLDPAQLAEIAGRLTAQRAAAVAHAQSNAQQAQVQAENDARLAAAGLYPTGKPLAGQAAQGTGQTQMDPAAWLAYLQKVGPEGYGGNPQDYANAIYDAHYQVAQAGNSGAGAPPTPANPGANPAPAPGAPATPPVNPALPPGATGPQSSALLKPSDVPTGAGGNLSVTPEMLAQMQARQNYHFDANNQVVYDRRPAPSGPGNRTAAVKAPSIGQPLDTTKPAPPFSPGTAPVSGKAPSIGVPLDTTQPVLQGTRIRRPSAF